MRQIKCSFCLKEEKLSFAELVITTTDSPVVTKELCKDCFKLLARNENSLFMRMHGITYCEVCIQPHEDCDCKAMRTYDSKQKKNWT